MAKYAIADTISLKNEDSIFITFDADYKWETKIPFDDLEKGADRIVVDMPNGGKVFIPVDQIVYAKHAVLGMEEGAESKE